MAKVLEGPGMGLMKKWGIHVPNYVVVTSADELAKLGQANDWMKTSKLVAKAHEALGSRMKLGLVKVGLDLSGAVAATKFEIDPTAQIAPPSPMNVPQVLAPTDSGSATDQERRGLPVEATAFAGPAASGPGADPSDPAPSAAERRIDRLLDANLDRAREGLRVLEDWARFGLDRADLVARCKDLRQRLGQCHLDRYRAARRTATDVAAGMEHPAQAGRHSPEAVLRANAARVQEALRVLEEFGRERDTELAAEAASCRYALYDLDTDLLRSGQLHQDRRARLAACHLYLITRPMVGLEAMVASALADRKSTRLNSSHRT